MSAPQSSQAPTAALWILLSAAIAVFITGNQEVWAAALFFTSAGAAMVACRPAVRPGWIPLTLGLIFCLTGLLAFLPQAWFPAPAWRALFPPGGPVPIADSVSPQPWIGWYWWLSAVAVFFIGAFLLSRPLKDRALAVFLHAVALVVAAYAVLAIFAWQTGWEYPFAFGGVFGFLANKNNTGTLLYIGAIVSFGLMQWEVVRGHRGAAALAALCGAPPLAGLLFFSNSRAGVICLALGIVLWALGAAQGPGRRRVLAGAGIMVVFLAVLFVLGGSEVRNRLEALWQDAIAVQTEDTDRDVDFRQPVFRDTMKLLRDVPLTGVGLGQFTYVFPQYRAESARAVKVLHPESSWLMVASESGLVAVAALLGVVVWFFIRCWRARKEDDGLLRWTAASAVGAAMVQALVDVPWHRPALGWFMFVVALVAVPSTGLDFRRPSVARGIAVFAGLLVMAGGVFVGWERFHGRMPAPFRWSTYTAELNDLGQKGKNDEGEFVAAEAIRAFPLKHEAYYWLVGYLRMFLGTEAEIAVATKAGRMVEPILPQVPTDEATLWKNLDPMREAEAWGEAARRAVRIDLLGGRDDLPSAGFKVQSGTQSLRGKPEGQQFLLQRINDYPVLTAYWAWAADPGTMARWAAELPDAGAYLDALPENLREVVLNRWIALPDASPAIAYMEAKSLSEPGLYGVMLAKYRAASGDKPGAVGIVAKAAGVPLEGGWRGISEFGREIAALEAQGNDVAVRRLLREAVELKPADPGKLKVAMAAYAAAGDWDMAWRAASRLASETELRH
ncbi:MAG: O-antigen ligase family protein [Chthoniobacterales bacterium]|nr:O-antigen ligase family protein [Chthoniobacterales bacterium]